MFGGDPELFVVNKKSGKIVSSHRFFDNAAVKKANAHDRNFDFGQGKVKRDGVAVEIELGPSYCRDWVVPKTFYYMAQTLAAAKEAGFNNIKLSGAPVAELTKASIKGAPEDCMILGCNPDYSAYIKGEKAPTLNEGDVRRYTGGHLHFDFQGPAYANRTPTVNWRKATKAERIEVGAAATVVYDFMIGLPSVAVLGEVHGEREAERREKYGQAGSYRIPTHGIEYRVLSGNGLILHPVLLSLWIGIGRRYNSFTLDQLKDIIDVVKEYLSVDEMREIIDTHDYRSAWSIVLDGLWETMVNKATYGPSLSERKLVLTLARACQDGVSWGSDVGENWGATYYPEYRAVSHNYWGAEGAVAGFLDDSILPQRKYLAKTPTVNKAGRYVHPRVRKQTAAEKREW